MNRAIAIVRNFLWAEGAFFCLGIPQIAHYLYTRAATHHSSDPKFLTLQAAIYGTLGYLFVCGLAAVIAAYGLEQNQKWTQRALTVASLFNLPVVPIGTAMGWLGLWIVRQDQNQISFLYELATQQSATAAATGPLSRPKEFSGRVAIFLQVITSLILVPLTAAYLQAHHSPVLGYWQFVASFLIAVLLGIFSHELGHVVAGLSSGFKFRSMAVGPLVISLLSDGWRLQWVNSLGLWNGMTVMAPRRPERLRSNAIFFIIGGPIASLLIGSIGLVLLLAGPRLQLREAAEFFGILGVVEMTACVVNFLPLQIPGGYTDGARMLQLLGRRPEGDAFLAQLAFGLSDTTSLRPKDWHPEWIRSVTSDPLAPGFPHGCYQAYMYHLDRGETDDASVWLARCMDSHKALQRDPYRYILAIENAYFEARHLHNLEAARQWMTVPRAGVPAERYTLLRIKAALHVAEGERDLAQTEIHTALRIHAQAAETGRQQFERAVLRDVQNWFDESNGATGLARLAEAVRERDMVVEASKLLGDPDEEPSKLGAIRSLIKRS